eukprot:scaffold3021_cov236-Pinguiococcus_pyrenoidosus.AAC.3
MMCRRNPPGARLGDFAGCLLREVDEREGETVLLSDVFMPLGSVLPENLEKEMTAYQEAFVPKVAHRLGSGGGADPGAFSPGQWLFKVDAFAGTINGAVPDIAHGSGEDEFAEVRPARLRASYKDSLRSGGRQRSPSLVPVLRCGCIRRISTPLASSATVRNGRDHPRVGRPATITVPARRQPGTSSAGTGLVSAQGSARKDGGNERELCDPCGICVCVRCVRSVSLPVYASFLFARQGAQWRVDKKKNGGGGGAGRNAEEDGHKGRT